jgi:outer membrane protein OmpA-like peptidoglycan-associated protein
MGDIVSGQTARAKLVRAAKIGAVAPGTSGQYMAQQEAEMRRLTAGTGIDVIPYGDSLIIRLPASLAFDVGRADVKPQFKTTLEEIARPLKTFGRTYVDVLGHTDTTGTPQGNQALSQKRAAAVSDYLGSRGVSKARLAAKGYGESVPLYNPDDTELKRASNRRVEIRIVPIR